MYTLEQPKVIHKSFQITKVVEKALQNDMANGDEQFIEVSGYASRMYMDGDFVIDADQENINTFGFDLKRLKNGILPLLYNHKQDQPVGKVLEATYDKDGLLIKAKLFKYPGDQLTNFVYNSVKAGVISAFSVGILVKDFDVITQDNNEYLQLSQSEVIEISLVAVPSNPEALFRVTNLKSFTGEDKTVTLLEKSALKAENTDACNGFECAITKHKELEAQKEETVEVMTKDPATEENKETVVGVTPEALDKLDEILDPEQPTAPVEDSTPAEGEVVAPESQDSKDTDKSNDKPSEEPKEELEQTPEDKLHNNLSAIGELNVSELSDEELERVYETLAPLVEQIEARVVAEVAAQALTISAPAE